MEIVFHFPRKKTPRNYQHNMNETIILEKFRTGNEKTLYELVLLIRVVINLFNIISSGGSGVVRLFLSCSFQKAETAHI